MSRKNSISSHDGSRPSKMQKTTNNDRAPLFAPPTSPTTAPAFFTSQESITSEGATISCFSQSELVIQEVATQATTAICLNELTDHHLRTTRARLIADYDLFMTILKVILSDPINPSDQGKLVKMIVRQKDRIIDYCEELDPARAQLRKDFRDTFPAKRLMSGVNVYTGQTGRLHPINGRLLQQLDRITYPMTSNASKQTTKPTERSRVDPQPPTVKDGKLMTPSTSPEPESGPVGQEEEGLDHDDTSDEEGWEDEENQEDKREGDDQGESQKVEDVDLDEL